MPLDLSALAAILTGVGALLAGWGSLRKAKSEGKSEGKAEHEDALGNCQEMLGRLQNEIDVLVEKAFRD